VNQHYSSLVACRNHVTEVSDFITETGYCDLVAYGVWHGNFEDCCIFFLLILVLDVSSFGKVCIAVGGFELYIDVPCLCMKLVCLIN
jgi:hypothetical protein